MSSLSNARRDAAERSSDKGRSFGTAGRSVNDAGTAWAGSAVAKVGAAGEVRTATEMDRHLPAGVVVLNDLSIPITGFKANIDHIVVSGKQVTIVDSKAWAGGFYWTRGSKTYRGLSRFEPAEKQTMVMASRSISAYLSKNGLEPDMATPVVVVWPTSSRLSLWAARFPGADLLRGDRLRRACKSTFGDEPADPGVVQALIKLLK